MANYNFDDVSNVNNLLKESQDAHKDQREQCREAMLFVTKKDGQWEPRVWQQYDSRFRGTFDQCGPIVDSIAGEIEQSDFTLRVGPAGGEATEDIARTYDGLIRNIRNMSNAEYVFQSAGRTNVIQGFDAWEVVQEYVDGDSFDQDLLIKRIPDAVNSVWFDTGSMTPTGEDAKWVVVLTAITPQEYEKRFPDGAKMSVGDDRPSNAYWTKANTINIGRIMYKKKAKKTLIKMSDGSVYDEEQIERVKDDLEQKGITEVSKRERETVKVMSRMFDGGSWLTEEEETVFSHLPVIPVYGNFEVVEQKVTYSGKLLRMFDPQRALNYAVSRDIEDGAISPSPTVWMTEAMAEGHDYSTMNIDRAGVRFFNPDDVNPNLTPQYTGGPQSSPGLQTTIGNMQQMIASASNMFNAQQGNANPTQSGVAGAQQIDQGNIGSTKWFKSLEIAIQQTGKVLLSAIPKVYDSTRQVRIVGEDGTGKMVTLNETVIDAQTQQAVPVNDLSQGLYDVFCEVGPAFNNQQREAVQAFLDAAAVDPTLLQMNKDLWLKNQQSPIMRDASERARAELFNAGLIPEEQWTDEERQKVAEQQALAAQQPPQEDPNMVLARAEEGKAIAEQTNAQTKQFETQTNQQLKAQELALEQQKIELDIAKFQREKDDKFNVEAAKINQGQQKLDQEQQKIDFAQQMESMRLFMEQQAAEIQELKTQADTWKTIKETSGVDAVISPTTVEAMEQQGEIVTNTQENQDAAE